MNGLDFGEICMEWVHTILKWQNFRTRFEFLNGEQRLVPISYFLLCSFSLFLFLNYSQSDEVQCFMRKCLYLLDKSRS